MISERLRNRGLQVGRYGMSLPERAIRVMFAGVGGAAHETGELLLPRFVRRSKLYEVTAKNLLRIAIELVGGVERATAPDIEPLAPTPGRLAVKKAAGNAVELGSIAAFGFSPVWLLAAASDILNGSRVYLRAIEGELVRTGYLAPGISFASLDQLLNALEGTASGAAGAIDMPPIEVQELRMSITELASDVASLPKPVELAALFNGLVRAAREENRPLLEVSSGIGLAFLTSARSVSHRHVVVPYREDWRPLRQEGFGAYAARVSVPYRKAVAGHLRPGHSTWTERFFDWTRRNGRTQGHRKVRFWVRPPR